MFLLLPSLCVTSYTPPPPVATTAVHYPRAQRNIHHLITITLSFIGFACFFYCLFCLYKLYKNARGPLREPREARDHEFLDRDQGPIVDHPIWYIRSVGLQPPVIDSIAVCKYTRGKGLVEGTDCSVCLSEFENDETLKLLPKCNHAFHLTCIDTWLRSHTNCPLCRAPIVSVPNRTLSPILEQNYVENRQVASEEAKEIEEGRNDRDLGSKSATSSQHWRRIEENEETNGVQPIRRSVYRIR